MKEKKTKDELINKIMNEEWDNYTLPIRELLVYYECAILELETKFKVLDLQFNIAHHRNPIESINSRLKSVDRIVRKLKKYGCPLTIESIEENLWDVAGIRVICSFKEDIYFLEKNLAQQDDIKVIMRKDYIKNPKENGYRSLHLRLEVPIFLASGNKKWVKAEVQFRTIAMDFWASLEHKIRYDKLLKGDLDKINREILECASMCSELDDKMQKVKNYSDIESL